jgi:hypothetical protein
LPKLGSPIKKGGIVSIKLPIRSGQHWAKAVLLATSAVVFFWAFYRTGIARNFFDSKQFSWVASIASILGVGVLPKVSGRKRQFTMATVVLFTLAALVGKASEPPDYRFQLIYELWGPKPTKATSPNFEDKRCGSHSWIGSGGKELFDTNLFHNDEGYLAFKTLVEFEQLFDGNVCGIRSILGSLGVNTVHNAVMARFDACNPSTNRIVLLTAPFPKSNSIDGNPFLHNWMDYGGTPLYGAEYRTAWNGTCADNHEMSVVIFPESGVMVDKTGLNPSFIPR